MDGLIALGLAAAIPFILTRILRVRLDDLERQVLAQAHEIRVLSAELDQMRAAASRTEAVRVQEPERADEARVQPPVPVARPAPTPAPVPPVEAEEPSPGAVEPPVRVEPPVPAPPLPVPSAASEAPTPGALEPERPAVEIEHRQAPLRLPPMSTPAPPSDHMEWSFDWERLVGVKVFSVIAGVALVLAAIFFLRYSIEHGWLQPPVRVAIGVVTAIGLLVACEWKAARRYPATANALNAAAIAILFATFFSAHALWKLIPASATFGLLGLVTATAVLLSVRHHSLLVAMLGLVGGFATPVLLSTGENRPIALFSYLLLLNVGLAWVAYRRGWAVLSALSLLLTTLYQWGWVLSFLATSSLPLAVGIFVVFPLVGYGAYLIARSRPETRDHAGGRTFEWTALAASAAPLLFALYLATVRPYGDRYGLLFGLLFLIDAGLFAIAVSRGREILHLLGASATLVITAAWLASSYPAGAWAPVSGIAVGFMTFYLVAPVIASRAGRPFTAEATRAIYVAPLLMFVFPVLARIEPATASPAALFATLFTLVIALAWRALEARASALYYGAVFFALATEALWSATHLTFERLNAALLIYGAFGVLYVAVPLAARHRERRLEPPAAGSVVLLASMLLLMFLAAGPLAAPATWGLALLLVVMTAAAFVEGAGARLPWPAAAASALSWLVLLVWWSNASTSVGPLPSWILVVGLTLLTLAGQQWAWRQIERSDPAAAAIEPYRHGPWIALTAYLFLLIGPQLPPWPLFGALAVVSLAISTFALAQRRGALHFTSAVLSAVVVLAWIGHTHRAGFGVVGIAAEAALVAFALSWIVLARRFTLAHVSAAAAGVAVVTAEVALMVLVTGGPQPPLALLAVSNVIGISLLLTLAARYEWRHGTAAAAALAGVVLLVIHGADEGWRRLFVHALVMYVPFALFPLVLGGRARENRDPYVGAILASVWCFLAIRDVVMRAGYEWMVGIVPIALGTMMMLHVRQLLRLQPAGARDLGRLALVAGTALAFATLTIPLQLSQQWITIGWALEGAAVAWLYRRVPHRGLLYASAGLLAAVFVRLVLNPDVFQYEPRGSMRVLNWYLYTYVICAAAMFCAAWWLQKTDDVVHPRLPRPRHALPAGGGILLFLLLNIEIADFYATGPEIVFRFGAGIGQDLTYTLGWLVFGLATLAAGIILRSRAARIASVVLIAVTTFKCFLYDLGSLGGLHRVGAFVGLALSLTLVSLALQRFVLAQRRQESP